MKILLAIIVFVAPAIAGATSKDELSTRNSMLLFSEQMNEIYGKTAGYQLNLSVQKGKVKIAFCPDNTCDEFNFSTNASLGEVYDFIYLFEFYMSSYYEMERNWKNQDVVKKHARVLLDKYLILSGCHIQYDLDNAICVIRHLLEINKISLSVGRYDEGNRVSTPIELEEYIK